MLTNLLIGGRPPRRRLLAWYRPVVEALETRTLPSFIAAPAYPAGDSPSSVAVGDFNADGHLDLAVADSRTSSAPGDVRIYLGKGDGTFQAAQTYATDFGSDFVAVGDFNGDGVPDLAVANLGSHPDLQGTVSVLLGNGDGTFQPSRGYAVGSGPKSVAVGDLNGDGHMDLAVAGADYQRDTGVSVLLGNGDGTFQARHIYAAGSYPDSVAIGDFNGDGHLDLAVGDANSTQVSVLLGMGDGTFQAAQNFAINSYANSLVVGDFDGDGIPDLAVAGSVVTLLRGKGDGTFYPARSYAIDGAAISLGVGDFNDDGIPDLAVAGSVVTILLGRGDGTFRGSQDYAPGGTSVAAGDFDGDGHPDLAVTGAYTATLSVLLGTEDGTLQAAPTSAYGILMGASPSSVAAGDFDGDGHLDLALTLVVSTRGGAFSNLAVLLGGSDATFQARQSYFAPFGHRVVAVADFNGDGHPDLAVASDSGFGGVPGTVSIFLGNGDGTFQTAQIYPAGDVPSSLAVGDFNTDGHLDLAVVNSASWVGMPSLMIFLGNGDGTFQEAQIYAADGFYYQAVAAGDFDHDGHLDLVVASGDYDHPGNLSVFLGSGDGTFRTGASYPTAGGPHSVAVGDFDGDGHLDLAVAGSDPMTGEGSLVILRGKGDGTFQVMPGYTAGTGFSFVVAADFNRDGYPDLAVGTFSGTVSIFLSNGDGSFSLGQNYAAGMGYYSNVAMAVGDFNADGYPDLAAVSWPGLALLINAADWGGSSASARPRVPPHNPGSQPLPQSERRPY